MAVLRAKKPEQVKPSKPKILVFGRPGVGKTWTALDFPKPYYIDTEGGADLPHYQAKLDAAGGVYLGPSDGSQDFAVVIEQVQALATQRHDYRTLIIDSFSKLYNIEASIAEEKVGSDYGRDKKEAQRPTKRLMRWLDKLDMTVILICHEKDKWERKGSELTCIGQTFDGYDKLEYDLHLALQVMKQGASRKAFIRKSRLEKFPESENFMWSYAEFAKRFGQEVIERTAEAITLATAEQVGELKRLVDLMKIDKDETDKWLSRAGVERFEEMDEETITKCITYLKKKLEGKE